MSDLIVKIGDDALDLSMGETIAITKQAAKVGDFSTVLADGTNEVTVPLTPTNKVAMDNAHLITTDSGKPYTRLDATLIQEGYETIQDGYALIKKSANNFSLQVVGGNATFFDLIKDLDLRDIDQSAYDHFHVNQEVFDRRNETEGLCYPLFEQGLDATTMTTYGTNLYAVETELLLPCFSAKTLIEQIVEAQGYTFVTDMDGEFIYDKLAVFRGAIPNRGNDMSHHHCTVTSDFLDAPTTELFDSATVTDGLNEYTSSAEFQAALITPTKRFIMTDSCTITVDFTIILRFTGFIPYNTTMRIDVLATSSDGITTYQSNTIPISIGIVDDPDTTHNFTMTFDVADYQGDIYFQVRPFFAATDGFFMNEGTSYTVYNAQLIENGPVDTLNFPYNFITGELPVPDMKQSDFMKEMARIFQWIFDTDERTKTLTAYRFDQIKEQIPNALDLSDKLNAESVEITYGIDGFAQTNALRYKEDDITKYDAVGYINVDDTTLAKEKDYVKMSQFAATSTKRRFDTVSAPYVPIFEESLPTNGYSDRIFLLNRVTFPYNINFNRDGETPANLPTNDVTFAYFQQAGNPDSLNFPNLIDRFYQTVIDMTYRAKSIDCLMNLNIKDVVNYDPLRPVYISSLGNYFYWEKLSNYVKDKLTKCKFVRI